ncbi:fumarylacetoacetate hydrolase family protein [Thalassotalea maritima]|uniref:fumarylacetoacetate hydrolase family protein n=1 Tax=Thalassotalea maritima TaxID=3242416 RepID=UPI0035288DD6
MQSICVNNQSVTPSKIVCVGRNYVEHIQELNNEIPEQMVVFNKPNSSLSHELNSVHGEPLHYEAELCFVYQQGRFSAVGLGLDLTKRQLQSQLKSKGLPWERAKAFDGSAVFSDFVAIEQIEPSLRLELWIDEQLVQSGGIKLMMYKPDDILAQLQSYTTLVDGDVVMTGTPKGVGEINAGSRFVGKVFVGEQQLIEHAWLAI